MRHVGYYEKRVQGARPNTEDSEIRMRQLAQNQQACEEYKLQNMPEAIIRGGQIFCPYADCGSQQREISFGVHTCTSRCCGRQFQVLENDVTQKIQNDLVRGDLNRQRQAMRDYDRKSLYGFFEDHELGKW